jgi:alpha-tubulin suppressor-like RCC1 family protein
LDLKPDEENDTPSFTLLDRLTPHQFDVHISRVVCGKDNSALITEEGFLFMMGSNKHAKLGIGLSQEACPFALQPVLVESLTNVHDVSLGKRNSMALTQDGEVFAWGQCSIGFPGYEQIGEECQVVIPKFVYRGQQAGKVYCGVA